MSAKDLQELEETFREWARVERDGSRDYSLGSEVQGRIRCYAKAFERAAAEVAKRRRVELVTRPDGSIDALATGELIADRGGVHVAHKVSPL